METPTTHVDANHNYVHRYPFQVLESHLDFFGHMNHIVYLDIFEEARWDCITERGYGLEQIRKTHLAPVILEFNVQFKRELLLRQKFTVETRVKSSDKKISQIYQEMIGENGKVHCQADFKFALFDTRERKMVIQTPEWLHSIGVTVQAP